MSVCEAGEVGVVCVPVTIGRSRPWLTRAVASSIDSWRLEHSRISLLSLSQR